MATRIRTEPTETLLNRELSHLEFHARVLELATDESLPLLERVKFCAIFSSNLDEFFQVRVAGPPRAGRSGGRGPLSRRADAAAGSRADPRARARALGAPVTPLEARPPPRARSRRDHRRRHRGPRREGARASSRSASIVRSTPSSPRSRSDRASPSRTSRDSRSRSRSSPRIPRRERSGSPA